MSIKVMMLLRESKLRGGASGFRQKLPQDMRGEAPDDRLGLGATRLLRHIAVQVKQGAGPHVAPDREFSPSLCQGWIAEHCDRDEETRVHLAFVDGTQLAGEGPCERGHIMAQ